MKNLKTQSGFAHLVIVVIVALLLVGGVGYVVYQNLNPKPIETTENSVQDKDQTSKDDTETAENNDGYLVLSDWGVKFKVPSDTGDRTINYYKGIATKGDSYLFTTSEVENLGGTCAYSSGSWVALGSLGRATVNNGVENSDTQGYQGELVKKIDDYYYFYDNPVTTNQGNCSEASVSMQTEDQNLIENLLKSIEKS